MLGGENGGPAWLGLTRTGLRRVGAPTLMSRPHALKWSETAKQHTNPHNTQKQNQTTKQTKQTNNNNTPQQFLVQDAISDPGVFDSLVRLTPGSRVCLSSNVGPLVSCSFWLLREMILLDHVAQFL